MHKKLLVAALSAALFVPLAAQSKTLRWASQGDILTLDPHAQNEGLNIAASSYVYEPLVQYDKDFQITPALATEWETPSDTLWRFKIREGVKFHDGSDFTAEDAVFSIQRAMAPTSNFKAYVNGIKEARAVDPYILEIELEGANPVLLRQLTNVFMMSKAWSEANNTTAPQDFTKKEETYSARNAMGTGPYKLTLREVDIRTEYTEHDDWWNKANKTGNVTNIVYTPISQNATRTAALLSGEIDFVLDPPAQDLERIKRQAKIVEGNEYRTIYIGLDQKSDELKYSTLKGKNPFTDPRIREALYLAIDTEAIKRSVMRGSSAPTGTMVAPQVNGWSEDLAQRPKPDVEKAKALIAEAGFEPNEINFTLDCPNNRYINDEAICQAIVAMWARIGVDANLNSMPRATYFPKVQSYDTSAYLFGWGVPTFDALYTLQSLLHTKGEDADGSFNFGYYENAEVDKLIDIVKTETDEAKRNDAIHQALKIHGEEFGHLPIHDQVIPWGMAKNVDVVHRADNRLTAEWVVIND